MPKSPKFVIDCADHAGFVRISKGKKTVLTRANKIISDKVSYRDSKPGDILELVDIKTDKRIIVEVTEIQFFENIVDMFNKSNIAYETFDKYFNDEDELRAEYENNRPGYTKLLDTHGIVAWHIKLI